MPIQNSPNFLKAAYFEGLAKPNRFQVAFFPPLDNIDVSNLDFGTNIMDALSTGRLLIGCRSAQWPSLTLTTTERRTKGPVVQIPYDQVFEEAQLEFISDRFHYNHTIFKEWFEFIYDPKKKRLEFIENYATDLEIFQLDETGIPINRVKLENAYPKSISEMDLSHENNDEIQTFTVDFVYDNIVHGFEGLGSDIAGALGL